MARYIDADALLKKFDDAGIQITFDLPVEEILGEEVDLDDFTMLVQDAIQAYRKMAIDTIKNQPTGCDPEAVVEQLEDWLNATGCIPEGTSYYHELLSIVRNAGKDTDDTTNNDFCEWEDTESLREKGIHYGSDGLYKPSCNGDEDDFRDWNWIRHFKFCPYCGKKIKVVE